MFPHQSLIELRGGFTSFFVFFFKFFFFFMVLVWTILNEKSWIMNILVDIFMKLCVRYSKKKNVPKNIHDALLFWCILPSLFHESVEISCVTFVPVADLCLHCWLYKACFGPGHATPVAMVMLWYCWPWRQVLQLRFTLKYHSRQIRF